MSDADRIELPEGSRPVAIALQAGMQAGMLEAVNGWLEALGHRPAEWTVELRMALVRKGDDAQG